MSTFAGVEDSTSFICTAQLRSRESDLCAPALVARFVCQSFVRPIIPRDSLDYGQFLAQ
jgi:hypothetical protein